MFKKEHVDYWREGILPYGTGPSGVALHWRGTDSLENFRKNPKPGYTETSIIYKFNSNGYRTKEFDLTSTRPKVVLLGCSHVEGVGLREEDTLAYKLFQKFQDYDCYALGIPGCSGDTVVRTITNLCGILTPAIVFILWPDPSRYEYWDNRGVHAVGPWNLDKHNLQFINEEHQFQNRQRNRRIVELLSHKYGFKVVESSVHELGTKHCPEGESYARDVHHSPHRHTGFALTLHEMYEQS